MAVFKPRRFKNSVYTEICTGSDLGLTGLNARGRSDLLEILDDRVGTGSMIMLGQMPVKDWHAFINDPALADAILDRLIHSSHKLELKGDSMRKRRAISAR